MVEVPEEEVLWKVPAEDLHGGGVLQARQMPGISIRPSCCWICEEERQGPAHTPLRCMAGLPLGEKPRLRHTLSVTCDLTWALAASVLYMQWARLDSA